MNVIHSLKCLRNNILDEVDDRTECRGRDSQLSKWADTLEAIIDEMIENWEKVK